MPPPPAEPFAARIFLGPALRTQPDRRLVKLVREGYEGAFEEIVRRYRKPLDRFAAGFVGNRSEDVTQDAFSKALLALRGSEKEIELRPWLYRIVRNTALNDLRDGPPPTAELGEAAATGPSAAVEAERREEITDLMERLQALPEPQRAAIVMRELEGLSHEEIAAGLGVSGGAARQAIHRARTALRDGLGMLVPLPLLRLLFEQGSDAAAGGAAAGGAAVAAGATAAGGGAATVGGIGAVGALKVGLATAVLAGSVGAGVAAQHDRGGERRGPDVAEATTFPGDDSGSAERHDGSGGPGPGSAGDDRGGGISEGRGDDRGRNLEGGRGANGHRHDDRSPGGSSQHGSSGPSDGDDSGRSGHSGHDGSGEGDSGSGEDSGSGHSGRGSSGSGSGHSGSDDGTRGGSGSSDSGSGKGDSVSSDGSGSEGSSGSKGGSGSGSGGSGRDSGSSDDGGEAAPVLTTPPPEPAPDDSSGSGSSGSDSESGSSGGSAGSGGSGSSGGSGGSGDDS